MEEKISVIIPVYNVEQYIGRCLDSVINQSHKNLEIICINDGSTDNSGKICEDYAKIDSRIRVFHKKNGGLSSARNVGLRNFTGQYIGFVDSDDWIEPDMYEALYEAIKDKDVSLSVAGYFINTKAELILMKNATPIPNRVLSQREMLQYIYRQDLHKGFHVVVWNKLYSADIFKKYGVMFNENDKFAEDVVFTPSVILTENCKGVYVDKHLYHHCIINTSLMQASSIEVKEKGFIATHKAVIDLFIKNGYDDLVVLVKKELCYLSSRIAELAIAEEKENILLRMQDEMKSCFKEYTDVYGDYPERIERIVMLMNSEISG